MPIACSRPYAAYISTSAEVIGGTVMVNRVSVVPRAKSRRARGFQPSPRARMPTQRATAPTMIAAQIRAETNHSLGETMPAGRYQGGW